MCNQKFCSGSTLVSHCQSWQTQGSRRVLNPGGPKSVPTGHFVRTSTVLLVLSQEGVWIGGAKGSFVSDIPNFGIPLLHSQYSLLCTRGIRKLWMLLPKKPLAPPIWTSIGLEWKFMSQKLIYMRAFPWRPTWNMCFDTQVLQRRRIIMCFDTFATNVVNKLSVVLIQLHKQSVWPCVLILKKVAVAGVHVFQYLRTLQQQRR